jgi:hypothetical protein
MPINPTTLKALIDTEITNETVDFAITPAEVGGRMKDCIDYTTEQIALVAPVVKIVKTTITSAQILALFDTPITVLDSSETGKVKLPLNIWVQRKEGDAYTLAAASFLLVNDSGSNVTGNLNPNPLLGTGIGFFTSAYTITQNNTVDKNALYKLKASTGNPTGGTGDIDVYVTYIEITL